MKRVQWGILLFLVTLMLAGCAVQDEKATDTNVNAEISTLSMYSAFFTSSCVSVAWGTCSSRKSEQLIKPQTTQTEQRILYIVFIVVAVFLE